MHQLMHPLLENPMRSEPRPGQRLLPANPPQAQGSGRNPRPAASRGAPRTEAHGEKSPRCPEPLQFALESAVEDGGGRASSSAAVLSFSGRGGVCNLKKQETDRVVSMAMARSLLDQTG